MYKFWKFALLSVLVSLLTACGFQGFKQSDVIDIGGDIYVITTIPIDKAIGGIERNHVPNPDTLDALGISRNLINNRGQSDAELEAIHKGSDIPDVDRDYRGFVEFKDQYFPNTIPIRPEGVSQTERVVKGKLGTVRAQTTSFEVGKGETINIPILVTSDTANRFEIWYPCCGNSSCTSYADVYPSTGSIVVGSTIQLQLVGKHVGQCSTMLHVMLYIKTQHGYLIEELEIPINIQVK